MAQSLKNLQIRRSGFDPGLKESLERGMATCQYSGLENSGWRSLAGYSAWAGKSQTRLVTHIFTFN